jgi:hypothetical protein
MARARSSGPTGRYLHYEPERIDYAVSDAELEQLRKGEHPLSKDFFLVTLALAIPTLLNALAETANQQEFKLTFSLFFNCLVGILCLMVSVQNGIRWYREKSTFTSVIDSINKKPRFEIPSEMLDVGAAKESDRPPS